jgi:hypothetical protein
MPLLWLTLHYRDIERIAQVRGHAEFEELSAAVATNIQGIVRRADPRTVSLTPTRRNLTHFEPGAHLGKPGFNRLRIHMVYFEDRRERVAQSVQPFSPVGFE